MRPRNLGAIPRTDRRFERLFGVNCMAERTRLSLDDLGRMTPRPGDNGEHERKRRQLVDPVFWTRSRKETFAAWLFIFPDCIGLLVFVAIPMVLALSLGFFSVNGFGGYSFVGLANYNRMLRDPLFIKSLGVTIVYVLCLVPGLYFSGLGRTSSALRGLLQVEFQPDKSCQMDKEPLRARILLKQCSG
jgi:hypothetical protein